MKWRDRDDVRTLSFSLSLSWNRRDGKPATTLPLVEIEPIQQCAVPKRPMAVLTQAVSRRVRHGSRGRDQPEAAVNRGCWRH